MKNFLQIAEGIDVLPLLLEIQRQPELWDKNPARLSKRGPHHESHDIQLRSRDEADCLAEYAKWKHFSDEHIPVWYKNIDYFPSARKLIFDLMHRVQAEMLGIGLIYKVEPGKKVYRHVDKGWCPGYYDKFNLCLQSNPRAAFLYDDEALVQRAGDVHHFRNDVPHRVANDGDCDHIILTLTMRCDRGVRVPWSPEGWTIDKQREATGDVGEGLYGEDSPVWQ